MKKEWGEADESQIECEEHRKKETEERELPIFRYNEKILLELPDIEKYSKYIWKSYILYTRNFSSYFE